MSTETENSNSVTKPKSPEPEKVTASSSETPPPPTKNDATDSSSLAGPTLAEAAAAAKKLETVPKRQDSKNSNKSRPKFRKNKVVLTGGNLQEQQKASNCPVRLSIETEQDKNEKRRYNRENNFRNSKFAGGDNEKLEKNNNNVDGDSSKNDETGGKVAYHKNSSHQEYASGDRASSGRPPFKPRNPLTRKLFVGGLPLDVKEEEINDYFKKYGTVENVMIKQNRGFAFVSFETVDEARKVLQFKGHKWGDEDMLVKPAINNENRRQYNASKNQVKNVNSLLSYANPKAHENAPVESQKSAANEQTNNVVSAASRSDTPNNQAVVETNKLFVGGLPVKCTETDLSDYFAQFGKLENVNLMFDQQTSRHRGFGFITFSDSKDARTCLDAKNEHKLHEKTIDVKTAVSRNNAKNNNNASLDNHSQNHNVRNIAAPSGPPSIQGHHYAANPQSPYFNPQLPPPPPHFHPQAMNFHAMNFPVAPFGPTYHHHHNHFYIPSNSLQKQQQQQPKNQHKSEKSVKTSEKVPENNNTTTTPPPAPSSSNKNPEKAALSESNPPINQFINQHQQMMQMPTLGPVAWGGFHPQHSHQLTYAKIFVGGLKRETTKNDLENYFNSFGKVRKLDLVMDPQEHGKNRGFAFVQYETVEACEAACQQQYHTIDGHKVEVKRAVLKPPGSNANDSPGINQGSVYGGRGVPANGGGAAAHGGQNASFPAMQFISPFPSPYMYPSNFGYEPQVPKPGAQQNLPPPKKEETSDKNVKEVKVVDENNNEVKN